eukprot:TRINITY_DN30625_c0_g1_i1.p1 TRINITY_DN30625_c0_g1~~TRINITY_DN30625_c0_g1_i1.p1  ORF type:complete len:332 (+),score=64.66 TRINITY_DN30625_c0_g1_i1:77-1072(+)
MRGKLVSLSLSTFAVIRASANISVFGHKVPDTDTVSSALVYAWELNERNIAASAYRLGELNPETAFVLEKLGVDVPPLLVDVAPKQQVAIVDTNNPEELPEGISKTSIHSIVDHHKLSGLTNAEPLEIDMRPLCSATSILYTRAKAAGLPIPAKIAGLMLSGIISDSLEFRSPTTTDVDRSHAEELGKIAGVDVHSFAEGMLEAKAKVDHLSPEELVMMDTKVFKIGGKKLRVSVLETTKPSAPLAKRLELIEAQKAIKEKEGLSDVLFFVVDILNKAATFVSSSPNASTMVERAWKVKVGGDGTVVLPGVLSRKKQIIPALEAAVKVEEL